MINIISYLIIIMAGLVLFKFLRSRISAEKHKIRSTNYKECSKYAVDIVFIVQDCYVIDKGKDYLKVLVSG